MTAVPAQPRQRDEDLLAERDRAYTAERFKTRIAYPGRDRHQTEQIFSARRQQRDSLGRIDRLAPLGTLDRAHDFTLSRQCACHDTAPTPVIAIPDRVLYLLFILINTAVNGSN